MLGEDGLETLSFRREERHEMPELVTGTHQQNTRNSSFYFYLKIPRQLFIFPSQYWHILQGQRLRRLYRHGSFYLFKMSFKTSKPLGYACPQVVIWNWTAGVYLCPWKSQCPWSNCYIIVADTHATMLVPEQIMVIWHFSEWMSLILEVIHSSVPK